MVTATGLLGTAAWLVWAVLTRQAIRARGFDFQDDTDRVFLMLVALGPGLVGASLVWSLVRAHPDIVIDSAGVHVRRMFGTRTVSWDDLDAVAFGSQRFGPIGPSEPRVLLRSTHGKNLPIYPKQFGTTSDELQTVLVDEWKKHGPRPPVVPSKRCAHCGLSSIGAHEIQCKNCGSDHLTPIL